MAAAKAPLAAAPKTPASAAPGARRVVGEFQLNTVDPVRLEDRTVALEVAGWRPPAEAKTPAPQKPSGQPRYEVGATRLLPGPRELVHEIEAAQGLAGRARLHVQEALKIFTDPWRVVELAGKGFEAAPAPAASDCPYPEETDLQSSLPRVSESSRVSVSAVFADIKEEDGRERDNSEAATALPDPAGKRPRLLHAYNPSFSHVSAELDICKRTRAFPPARAPSGAARVLVDCKALTLDAGDFAPLFLELAVWDRKAKQRLSESFYTQLNSEALLKLLEGHFTPLLPRHRCRRAVFSLGPERQTAHTVLVVQVFQTLSSDASKTLDTLAKAQPLSEKDRAALIARATDECKRLGAFRQLLLWGATPLWEPEPEQKRDAGKERGLDIAPRRSETKIDLVRPPRAGEALTEALMWEALEQLLDKRSLKRLGVLNVEVTRFDIDDETPLRGRVFNPFLRPVNMLAERSALRQLAGDDDVAADDVERRLVSETVVTEDTSIAAGPPHNRLVHAPSIGEPISPPRDSTRLAASVEAPAKIKSSGSSSTLRAPLKQEGAEMIREVLDFPSGDESCPPPATSFANCLFVYPLSVDLGDARNVCVRVQLKDSYEGVDDDAWPAFYGRADESGAQMMQLSAVSYHVRCPSFSDEFKLELPLNLRARHHLFFTFFNVTCKKTKGDKRPEKVVGYAMLPLLQDGRFVDEEQTLPVLPELRPHYLLSINQTRTNMTFRVRLRLCSNLYTNDPFLHMFFQTASEVIKQAREKPAEQISAASVAPPSPRRMSRAKSVVSAHRRRNSGSGTDLMSLPRKITSAEQPLGSSGGAGGAEADDASLPPSFKPASDVDSDDDDAPRTPVAIAAPLRAAAAGAPPKLLRPLSRQDSMRFTQILQRQLAAEDASLSVAALPPAPPAAPQQDKAASAEKESDRTSPEELEEQDRLLSQILCKVVRAGPLSRRGGLSAWKQRWCSLMPPRSAGVVMGNQILAEFVCYKDLKAVAPESTFDITAETKRNVAEVPGGETALIELNNGEDAKESGGATGAAAASSQAPEGRDLALSLLSQSADDARCWDRAINFMQIRGWKAAEAVGAGLPEAQPDLLVQFMHVVFRMLLAMINAPSASEELKGFAFTSMLHVAEIVEKRVGTQGLERCPLLDSFVGFVFEELPAHGGRVTETFAALAARMLDVLRAREDASEEDREHKHRASRYSWFVFDLIVKSMMLRRTRALQEVAAGPAAAAQKIVDGDFGRDCLSQLAALVKAVTAHILHNSSKMLVLMKQLNRNLALFLHDLFFVLDRQQVFELTAVYLDLLSSENKTAIIEHKNTLLQIVCDHELYVELCAPVPLVGPVRQYLTAGDSSEVGKSGFRRMDTVHLVADGREYRRADSRVAQAAGADQLFPMRAAASSPALAPAAHDRKASAPSPALSSAPPAAAAAGGAGGGAAAPAAGARKADGKQDLEGALGGVFSAQMGHFLPLALVKETERCFHAQERDILLERQAALLRNVALKHEYDARLDTPDLRARVAAMYLPLIPCLWMHERVFLEVKSEDARKDLLAVVLFVLRNVPPPDVLSFLTSGPFKCVREGDASARNLSLWMNLFSDLLRDALIVFQYRGSLPAGADLSRSILCPSFSRFKGAAASPESPVAAGDRGASGEKMSSVFAQLESKYAELSTAKDRGLRARRQFNSLRAPAVRALNTRAATLTAAQSAALTSAAGAAGGGGGGTGGSGSGSGLGGLSGSASVGRGTKSSLGMDPAVFKAERVLASEVANVAMDALLHILLPACESSLPGDDAMQEQLLWFVYAFLTVPQSDVVLRRLFTTMEVLLLRFSDLVFGLRKRLRRPEVCRVWWYQLLRHLCYRCSRETTKAMESFVCTLLRTNATLAGSLSRTLTPLLEAFADVFNLLSLPLTRALSEKERALRRVSTDLDRGLSSSLAQGSTHPEPIAGVVLGGSGAVGAAGSGGGGASMSGGGSGASSGGAGGFLSTPGPSSASPPESAGKEDDARRSSHRISASAGSIHPTLLPQRSGGALLGASSADGPTRGGGIGGASASGSGVGSPAGSGSGGGGGGAGGGAGGAGTGGGAGGGGGGSGVGPGGSGPGLAAHGALPSIASGTVVAPGDFASIGAASAGEGSEGAPPSDFPVFGEATARVARALITTLDNCLADIFEMADVIVRDTKTPLVDRQAAVEVGRLMQRLMEIVKLATIVHTRKVSSDPSDAASRNVQGVVVLEPETVADHLAALVELFDGAPRQQINHLRQLTDQHLARSGQQAEAACCMERIARIARSQGESAFASRYWKSEFWLAMLRQASALFEAASFFERAVAIERGLVDLHESEFAYEEVVPAQERLLSLYSQLARIAKSGEVRLLGTYYRVGFYGRDFGEDLDGREFVYREPLLTHLTEVTQRLVNFYAKKIGRPVTLIRDGGAVDAAKAGPADLRLQITSLEALPGAAHGDEDKIDADDQYHRIAELRRFVFYTPFTKSGEKAHGTVAEQWKRRTVLEVASTFPSIVRRMRVIRRTETSMSPLQCALDDIGKRVARLNHEVHPRPPHVHKLKTLSQVLSGSVALQVNGGVEEVCSAFFGPNADPQKPSELAALRELVNAFFVLCRQGIDVYRAVGGDKALAEALDAGYSKIRNKCDPLVGNNA